MRSVTSAEAELLAEIFKSAERRPVVIERPSCDLVLLSASDYEEAQRLLRKERIRELQEIRYQASDQARANGLKEDMLPELLRD